MSHYQSAKADPCYQMIKRTLIFGSYLIDLGCGLTTAYLCNAILSLSNINTNGRIMINLTSFTVSLCAAGKAMGHCSKKPKKRIIYS